MTYTQIFIKALLKSIFIFTVGLVLTLAAFFIALYIGTGIHMGAAHASGFAAITVFVMALFSVNYCAGILLVSTPIFAWIYSALSFHAFIKTSAFYMWKSKLSDLVISKVEASLSRLLSDKSGSVTDKADLKIKMLRDLSTDKSAPFIQRQVIKFALKKVDLSDIDTTQNQHLSSIITDKVKTSLENIAPPNLMLFYMTTIVHVVLLVFAIATKH